jgi:hypothetical protein
MLNEIKNKVKYEIDENNCWNITSGSYKEKQGYHILSLKSNNYKRIRAHRAMYISIYGNIPEGKIICHSCDNKDCINPKHLFLGTKKDNTQDMLNKNRVDRMDDRKGTKQKLSDEDVINIYNSNKSSYYLSEIYNVSDVQIRRIKNGSRCKKIINKYLFEIKGTPKGIERA